MARVTLEVVAGPLAGKRFAFEEHDTFIFGRHPDCHAHLSPDDATASRHHFLLEANPPDVHIRDLGSLNGTFVNGAKHGGRGRHETPEQAQARPSTTVELKDGDRVQVGATEFALRVEVPAHCVGCATPIPDAFKSVCTWVGGTHICPPCRAKAAAGRAPEAPPAPKCSQCGRDVAKELGERRGGDYVCHGCRETARNDPAAVLARVLAERPLQQAGPAGEGIVGYRLGKKLGAGGMGAVYLAERIADGRQVALKVMLAKVAVSEPARQAFLREIDVLKSLRHPNIVELIEHGSAGGAFYFVMEVCHGGSFTDLQERRGGRLGAAEAGPLMIETLDGLAHAHAQGYVHRDLKPANLLLASEGKGAKVSDFGFAKSFDKAGLSGMTQTGITAGTWPFMPREQLVNFRYLKPVSDVWSIGATFYYLLTGALPRDLPRGRDPVDVILENRIVPIRERDPGVPGGLAHVLDRAVAAKPEDRYADAGELRAALANAL